ncbi:hypothetical protein RHGRI_001566 [Rhododendron griersonianum]|nr:hypothetical protein RHGRI_001566 [Rhododendron griersonianum]
MYRTEIFNAKEFLKRLCPILDHLNIDEISIEMGNRTWAIHSSDLSLNYPMFLQFIRALQLEWTNYVFDALLANHKVSVVVFNAI